MVAYAAGYVYGRSDNPNGRELETCLAALEGGGAALAFSSRAWPPPLPSSRSFALPVIM